jgi:hypothetical protein
MKPPWHYIIWSRPALDSETEQFLANMLVRRGRAWALLVFWGLIIEKDSSLKDRALQFLDRNYAGVVSICLMLMMPIMSVESGWQAVVLAAGAGWAATAVIGSVRYLLWIDAILGRWT